MTSDPLFSPLLGLDIDITTGDIVFGTDGDVGMVAGQALLYQRFYCALVADNVLMAPGFGAGIGRYLQNPLDPANQNSIQERVATVIALDPAVESVTNVLTTLSAPNEVTITADVTLSDSLQALTFSFPLAVV